MTHLINSSHVMMSNRAARGNILRLLVILFLFILSVEGKRDFQHAAAASPAPKGVTKHTKTKTVETHQTDGSKDAHSGFNANDKKQESPRSIFMRRFGVTDKTALPNDNDIESILERSAPTDSKKKKKSAATDQKKKQEKKKKKKKDDNEDDFLGLELDPEC
mmetsp:Transcript_7618/g.13182  ORF Transcript_7618/g.13182 Transcript_7618/m.13182 type:complete len:162 (-) Transcript_7618:83-568(-)